MKAEEVAKLLVGKTIARVDWCKHGNDMSVDKIHFNDGTKITISTCQCPEAIIEIIHLPDETEHRIEN
jgi:hypothetical protein